MHASVLACARLSMYSKTDAIALGLPCEQHAAAVRAVIARSLSCNCSFNIVVLLFCFSYFLNILISALNVAICFRDCCLFIFVD